MPLNDKIIEGFDPSFDRITANDGVDLSFMTCPSNELEDKSSQRFWICGRIMFPSAASGWKCGVWCLYA